MRPEKNFEIAYILKGYPRLSETFIANEIHLLEQKGLRLHVYSVKKSGEKKVHPVVEKTQAPVTYLPVTNSIYQSGNVTWFDENFPKFASSQNYLFRSRPMTYLKTMFQAIWIAFIHRDGFFTKPRKEILKEFLQAGYIAREILHSGKTRHLHGHFSHGSTTAYLPVGHVFELSWSHRHRPCWWRPRNRSISR